MLALLRSYKIHLPPTWSKCPRVLASNPKKHQLCYVSKIESNAASVRTTVLTHLMPY